MRLYYLTSAEIGLIILRERRMKLSLYNDLNDPFELLAYALGDKLMRKAHKVLKEHFTKTKGVICFSDNWNSPVMWAHYAQKHYGFCFGFDLPTRGPEQEYVYPMSYEPERLKFEYEQETWTDENALKFIRQIMCTKAKAWEYEREWRVSADLKEKDPKSGFYYVDFGEQMLLREVILGTRNAMSVGQVAKVVKAKGPLPSSVQILRSRVAHQTFSIVRNIEVTPITVKGARLTE